MHFMKLASIAVCIAVTAALSGCMTITKGATQMVSIETPPTTGATCVLKGTDGRWVAMSPGMISIPKSRHALVAVCSKPGWKNATATVPSRLESRMPGNFVFGVVVGAGVDAATGAMNEYPDTIQVPMQRDPAAAVPEPVLPPAQ
jgi:hypothetical protein